MTWKNNWITGDSITATLLNDLAALVNLHDFTAKTTPVDADEMYLIDSAASNVPKKVTFANVKATLKTYFDSLATTLTNKSISFTTNTVIGTVAEFNTALQSADFYTTGGSDVAVADGGTGVSTITGIIKGNGTAAFTAASLTTDVISPTAVHATTTKVTPVVADELVFLDSAASFVPVRVNILDFLNNAVATYVASTAMVLTNKNITKRVGAAASSGTVPFDVLLTDQVNLTAQAAAITAYTPSNTPTDGAEVWFRIKDNGTARAIARGANFISGPATMITTTVINKTHLEMFKYDSVATKWVCCISHTAGY